MTDSVRPCCIEDALSCALQRRVDEACQERMVRRG